MYPVETFCTAVENKEQSEKKNSVLEEKEESQHTYTHPAHFSMEVMSDKGETRSLSRERVSLGGQARGGARKEVYTPQSSERRIRLERATGALSYMGINNANESNNT